MQLPALSDKMDQKLADQMVQVKHLVEKRVKTVEKDLKAMGNKVKE